MLMRLEHNLKYLSSLHRPHGGTSSKIRQVNIGCGTRPIPLLHHGLLPPFGRRPANNSQVTAMLMYHPVLHLFKPAIQDLYSPIHLHPPFLFIGPHPLMLCADADYLVHCPNERLNYQRRKGCLVLCLQNAPLTGMRRRVCAVKWSSNVLVSQREA